jgi:NifU-like protein involved in Fe-S cluster formation
MKSELLREHFINPGGIGSIENPDYVAYMSSDTCNDVVKLTLKISDGVILDMMAQVNGCGFSIAGASLFIKEVKGKRFNEVPVLIEKLYEKMKHDIQDKSMNCIKLAYKAYMSIYENIRQENK